MQNENMQKYLNSFRRLYYNDEHFTDKGTRILQRKAKILKLSEEECTSSVNELLEKYEEFIGLLNDIYEGEELTDAQNEEIEEFKKDLDLNEEEADALIEKVLGRNIYTPEEGLEEKNIEEAESKETDIEKNELENTENESEVSKKTIENNIDKIQLPNTEIILEIPLQKKNERFYYIYNAYARQGKKDFFERFFNLSSPSHFTAKNLTNIFYESFDDFFTVTHRYIIENTNYDTCTKESLYGFLGDNMLVDFAEECHKIASQINFEIHQDRENRRYKKGSSTTVGFGSIGFMAAVGVMSAAGKAASSISDSIANSKLGSQLHNNAVRMFKSISSDIELRFDEGISSLFNTISIYVDFRDYKDIKEDEENSFAILENFASFKDTDIVAYKSKLLKAVSMNPYCSDAYFELADCEDNPRGKIAILEFGYSYEIYENLKLRFRNQIYEAYSKLMHHTKGKIEDKVIILKEGLSKETYEDVKSKYEDYIYELEHEQKLNQITEDNFSKYNEEINTFTNFTDKMISEASIPFYHQVEIENNELADFRQILKDVGEALEIYIDLNSVVAIYECEKSLWMFTYTGFYVLDNTHDFIKGRYIDLALAKSSGIANTYIKITIENDREYEIPICSGWSSDRVHQLQCFISAGKKIWKDYINRVDKSLVIDAFKISQEKADETITKIINKTSYKPLKIKYLNKKSYYSIFWNKANTNGYPNDTSLNELAELKRKLELDKFDINDVENTLLTKYYLEDLDRLSTESISKEELRKILLAFKDKYNISDDFASSTEIDKFGAIYTLNNVDYALINNIRNYYESYGTDYFGKKLYFMDEIPKEKLKNAKIKYLNIEDNEILLFLYDNTMGGSGREGIAITNKYFYSDGRRKISLEEITLVSYYNNKLHIQGIELDMPLYITYINNEQQFAELIMFIIHVYNSLKSEADTTTDIESSQQAVEETKDNELNSSDFADKKEQYLISRIMQLQEDITKTNDNRVGINESIPSNKLKAFVKTFNSIYKLNLEPSIVIGYYDNTVLGKGDKGFAVVYDGICSTMPGLKGCILFEEMISAPTFEEVINSKIFLYTQNGKSELYCTGAKGPKKLFELITLLYHFHKNA